MPVKLFGLELADVAIVAILFVIVFNVSDHIVINLVVLILLAGFLRYAKKGRPQGYLVDLAAFVLSSSRRHVSLSDTLRPYPVKTSSKEGGA